jgi:hypothetical protein
MPRFTPIIFAHNVTTRMVERHLDAYACGDDFNAAILVTSHHRADKRAVVITVDVSAPTWRIVAEAQQAAGWSSPFDPLIMVDADAPPVSVYAALRTMWAIRREKAVVVHPRTDEGQRMKMTIGDVAFPAGRMTTPCAVVVDGEVVGRFIEDSVRALGAPHNGSNAATMVSVVNAWIAEAPESVGVLRAPPGGVGDVEALSSVFARARGVSAMTWNPPIKVADQKN